MQPQDRQSAKTRPTENLNKPKLTQAASDFDKFAISPPFDAKRPQNYSTLHQCIYIELSLCLSISHMVKDPTTFIWRLYLAKKYCITEAAELEQFKLRLGAKRRFHNQCAEAPYTELVEAHPAS